MGKPRREGKNPAAVELGRLGGRATARVLTPAQRAALGRAGGLKGGAARARVLTPEQRSEIARRAARARWDKAKGKE